MVARRLAGLLGVMALAGCGGGAPVDRAPVSDACETRVPSHPSDTLTIVLFDTVDLSHAPWGRNREERFVFGHLYETLLTVDCHGQLQPGLANRWVEASDGWMIEMRDDIRFWDDKEATAYDAAEIIKRAIARGVAFRSVDVVDEHSLILHGINKRPDLKLLALPMMAVAKDGAGGVAIGTGPWMPDDTIPVAEAVTIRPSGEVGTPVVRFVQGNVSDARDILDGTADAMITDDPTAIEYAREKERVALIPLAWDRVYVLMSRTRATAMWNALQTDRNALPLPEITSSLQNALARDVVRVEARGGSTLLRASEGGSTPPPELPDETVTGDPVPAVLYEDGDETARGLAERIVALAAMDTCSADAIGLAAAVPGISPSMRAKGLDPIAFRDALARGQFFGYIVPLSWDADYPLAALQFMGRAHWAIVHGVTLRGSSVPLVETRAHFIAISDRIGFVDDHNGTVHVLGPTVVKAR